MNPTMNVLSPCVKNKCDVATQSACTGCPEWFAWRTGTENWRGLSVTNRICPNCGSGNDMRALSPEVSTEYDYVCLNCSKYFTEDDVYIGKHERRNK